MGAGQSRIESYFQKRRTDENSRENLSGDSLEAQNVDEDAAIVIQPGHESIEMERVARDSSHLPATLKNCINKDDFLESFNMTKESTHEDSSLMMKFQFVDILPELNLADLQNISKKYHGKSKVLLLVSENEKKISIYWKSKEIDEFLELKHTKKLDWESSRSLSENIAEFLAKSLNNDHLGLVSKYSYHPGSKPIEIDLLADSRDFNLLLLAAENGNTEIVEILLKLDMNTSSMDNKVDAQSLAMEGQHFDVIYGLLQNNLTFPKSLDVSKCTEKMKEFCEVTEEVHMLIMSNGKEKLEEILNQHKNVRHFYNFSNKSALRVAIESKSFDAFDILLSKNVRFGSNENPAEYYEKMEYDDQRILRDIQNKYSQPFLDKHIHTLLSNSTACFDETEAKDKLGHVHRAFELLSENPFIKIILKIVAASKNFKIVFDFNREAVNVVDPMTTDNTQGVFYVCGKIYIGAKQLLDAGTVNETLAVLAHELCHFTMNLVYNNYAKPYKSQDKKTMEEFEEILRDCKKKAEIEEVIGCVFDCYPEEDHHAELIVRVVHLLALYRDMPEKLSEVRRIFIKLFEFYENKIVPELEQALPEIEGRDEKELKIKDKKISKFKKISIFSFIFGIVAAIVVALVLHTPTYSFNNLSVNERMSIFAAPIRYKGVDLELRDLYPENSTIYSNLTSEHISQVFNGNVLELIDPHLHYLEKQVTHKWENMSEKLKQKILTSNFTFQNESLKFKNLHEKSPEVFNYLSSEQILDVLDGKKLVVHEIIKNETKFYVERKFWDENIPEIYFEFMNFVDRRGENLYICYSVNNTETKKTFESFYSDFISHNISIQLKIINEIRQNFYFKKCPISGLKIKQPEERHNVSDTLLSHKSFQFNFDEAFKIANDTKLFILSAEAGTGKTVTFEQFTMRIKKEFPTFWVSYIDLKDYKHLYKGIQTLQDVKNMLETIFKLNSKNEFEKKIFEDFFESGNLILLWNGFDEISPDFSEDVIRILNLIKNETDNIQYVCTRPLYSDLLRFSFSVQTYSLVPFDDEEQENFIRRFFISENVDKAKIPNYIEKVQKIVKSTKSGEPFDTPLMLGMIAKLIVNDVKIYESENLYEIYQKFVENKIEIWKNKTEFGKKFVDDLVTKYRQFDMMKLYQSYAIKSELKSELQAEFTYLKTRKLKIMRQKVPKELTSDEISRMGILYINGPNNFRFVHKTFAEFFVAQYFIDNIYYADDEASNEEVLFRISTFKYALENIEIKKFIEPFLDSKRSIKSKSFDPQISKVLSTKHQEIFVNGYLDDILFIDFFKKDLKVLKVLLHLDENATLYTAIFNFVRFLSIDLNDVKNAVRPYLTDNEFERFLRGKDQKGVILFSEYCNQFDGTNFIHDYYKLDEELKSSNDPFYVFESIVKNLTENELKELLMTRIIFEHVESPVQEVYYMFNDKMWNLIETRLPISDQKECLVRALNYDIERDVMNLLLQKYDKFFSSDEIFEIFRKHFIPTLFYELLWPFIVNHTNHEQQKAILKQTKTCEIEICYPIGLLFSSNLKFNEMQEIYESYFNVTELQDFILSHSSDALPYIVLKSFIGKINKIIKFLTKIFQNNKNLLKDFLMRKIEPTNLNIFELLSDYDDWLGNLKALSIILESEY